MLENINVLDSILVEIGEFGKYQKRTCFFIVIASLIIYFSSVIFVFETIEVKHRCKIIGCDEEPTEFKPRWWTYAAPSVNNEVSKCSKYQRINQSNAETCNFEDFDQKVQGRCDIFVYETSEVSIMHDFNLHCTENLWKLTLVGSIHNFGTFVGLPISGILSDKFGRKTYLIYGMVLSGITGLARSFSKSYIIFIVLEFLDAFFISGAYATVWILGIEYVGPKKRILVTVLISSFFAFGGVIQALIAWQVQSWRILLQILYAIQLVMVFYYWLIPESTRWLLSKQRFNEAKYLLEKVAETNGTALSEHSIKQLEQSEVSKENTDQISIVKLFRSKTLILRLLTCAICWVCVIFLYFGFIINSAQLSTINYLNIILIILVEIPGNMAYMTADKIGRRLTLSGGFLIAGLSSFAFIFVYGKHWLKLVLYLFGKFGVAISISVLYTLTTEIFPTPLRNTLLSTCIMFGGFGAISAPQIPLLKTIWENLPLLLFGSVGLVASFLSLLLPETVNLELPNTIKEAENIGKKSTSNIIYVV